MEKENQRDDENYVAITRAEAEELKTIVCCLVYRTGKGSTPDGRRDLENRAHHVIDNAIAV